MTSGFPLGSRTFVNKRAAVGIEGVDLAVAEISDPQRVPQCTETRRHVRHAPGRLEVATLSESLEVSTIEVEHVHDATAFARYVVARCGAKARGLTAKARGRAPLRVAARRLVVGH